MELLQMSIKIHPRGSGTLVNGAKNRIPNNHNFIEQISHGYFFITYNSLESV